MHGLFTYKELYCAKCCAQVTLGVPPEFFFEFNSGSMERDDANYYVKTAEEGTTVQMPAVCF